MSPLAMCTAMYHRRLLLSVYISISTSTSMHSNQKDAPLHPIPSNDALRLLLACK